MRSLANERNVADRIRFERESAAMSYDGLARRMARAGAPIQSSAIYKIEKGEPPRRITVDELVGFAKVFDLEVSEMLMPMPRVLSKKAREITTRINDGLSSLARAIESLVFGSAELAQLAASAEPNDKAVFARASEFLPSLHVSYPIGDEDDPRTTDPISDAWHAMARGISDYADWVVDEQRSVAKTNAGRSPARKRTTRDKGRSDG